MFTGCDFVMGTESMVIVLPGKLPPDAPNYTVSASPNEIRIKAGFNQIAAFPYENSDVFDFLSRVSQIGIVEFEKGEPFPNEITNIAYVQTMRPQ